MDKMNEYMKTNNWKFSAPGKLCMLFGMLIFLSSPLWAQKENKHIRQGNDQYKEEKFTEAEIDYIKALEKNPESEKGQYNLGGALYKQDNYEDAEKLYSNIASDNQDKEIQSKAQYNLGNTFLKEKKFDDAVKAYKNSLRLNPEDMDAKYNLEYAKRMLQQQQQQNKNKDKNKDDKKDKKNKDKKNQDKKNQDKQKQDKKKQDPQKKDQQKQDQQKQDQQKGQQGKQDQQKGQQAQPQKMSKKDAERMLQALKNDENNTLKKVRLKQVPAKAKKNEKDW